ncbi:MAG: DUF2070 family protein [Candidatus Bathyarchaeia archaeon]
MLPSYHIILAFIVTCCMSAGILHLLSFSLSLEGLLSGVFLGTSLAFITFISDLFISNVMLKRDPIYNHRRTSALSLFSWIFWLPFIIMGFLASLFIGHVWAVKLCLLGFSAALILRFIAMNSTASLSLFYSLITALLPSTSCLVPFIFLWLGFINAERLFLFLAIDVIVCYLSSSLFTHFLNKVGQDLVGIPSIKIFRAFLYNWVADLNEPFEKILEKLGEEEDIEISILKFDRLDDSSPKAIIAVPSVHPGPFKNIGSSMLPSVLKKALEEKFKCVACVPLSLLGHELDLVSQAESRKLVDYTVRIADFKGSWDSATPLIKVSDGLSTVCCQAFGDVVFMSLSLAPKTTEDFPKDLSSFICLEAKKIGFKSCLTVNAHNSINGLVETGEALASLKRVAIDSLQKVSSSPRGIIKLGASTVLPAEFTLRDGMGPGGITVLLFEINNEKTAYVIIDGNNMVPGLREKILKALNSMGIKDGEIFTTDTHCVNALTLSRRGYHPIGEVIDHEKLIEYIQSAAAVAMTDLQPVKIGFRKASISKLRVIGRNALEKLCLLTDEAFQTAKKVLIPIFSFTAFLLVTLILIM